MLDPARGQQRSAPENTLHVDCCELLGHKSLELDSSLFGNNKSDVDTFLISRLIYDLQLSYSLSLP